MAVKMTKEEAKSVLIEMRLDESAKVMYFTTEPFKYLPRMRSEALLIAIEALEKELANEDGKEA